MTVPMARSVPAPVGTDLLSLDLSKMDPLTGPVWVEGARPGDALLVEVLEISLATAGWSAIIPGLGLLADRFPGSLRQDVGPQAGRS